jgi:tRNA(Ile)-lysidine synthase
LRIAYRPGERHAQYVFMDTDLLTHTRTFLAQQRLFTPAARLLVAVSGGPDSLGLLHILVQLRAQGGPELHVAHLDHGFRGAASAADAAFVAAQAAAWQTPITVAHQDVPALAQTWRLSSQAAARKARYAFLAQTARRLAAHAVATAHQADDQAETVLLHLLRGAGPAGLRGMRPLVPWPEWAEADSAAPAAPAPPLIRPLLAVPRAALSAYCAAAGLTPRDDPSNQSAHYTRTQVRRTLLPAFQAINPEAGAALGRTAAICADDYAYIQEQLDAVWPTLTHSDAHRISFAGATWSGLHAALQRYALRRAAASLGQTEVSFAQIEAARACTTAGVGKRYELGPDLRLATSYGGFTLYLRHAPPHVRAPQLEQERLPLAGGTTALGNGWLCVVQHEPPAQPSPWWIGLNAAGAGAHLSLRRRRPGDRIRPAGGRGSRKLQDLFVDRKIPRAQRDAWPILLVGEQIAWVAALRADAAFTVPPEQATIWVGIIRDTER